MQPALTQHCAGHWISLSNSLGVPTSGTVLFVGHDLTAANDSERKNSRAIHFNTVLPATFDERDYIITG